MADPLDIATRLAATAEGTDGAVTPPIVQSSLFTFASYQDFEDRMAGRTANAIYTRVQNPTVAAFEALMAQAECGEAAVGFASGMAAISSTVLALVQPGDRIAAVEHLYPDTYRLFERLLRPLGVSIEYHPPDAFEEDDALLRGVRLAYLESPTSVVFAPLDLPRVAVNAKRHGTLTIIDNSWASPVFQRPLTLGIDMVVHSASKYISGHSDTVAGVTVAGADHIAQIRDLTLPLLGAKLAPFEAFLLTRGLRTLAARMAQHHATATVFAERLAALPQVRKVNAPAPAPSAGRLGRSGLLSLEFDDSVDIPRFCDGLKLFRLGVSWGGFESLVLPARVALAQAGEKNSLQAFGVSQNLVRLNLGLEHAEDLWADFAAALHAAAIAHPTPTKPNTEEAL